MAGKKGRSGGAGRGQGRLILSNRDAPLDKERARAVKILILARGQQYNAESVRELLSGLIDAAYAEYEQPLLDAAEAEAAAWQGEVL